MKAYTKGIISAYSDVVSAGAVTSDDGKTYIFGKKDWASEEAIIAGMTVYFIVEHGRAKSVQTETPE